MKKLLLLLPLLVVGCNTSPQEVADDAQAKAQKVVQQEVHDQMDGLKKKMTDLASQKMSEAQNYVDEIKKKGSLSDAGKKFIEDTMKLKDGMASAAASSPIEEAIKNSPKDMPWIKEKLETAVKESSGQAQAAWKMLLDRVNEAMKK